MKNRRKNTEKQNDKNTNKPIIKNVVLEISKKLGIAIPAGLLLLFNINADVTTKNYTIKEKVNTAKEVNKLQTNETVKHLLSIANDEIILAQVHSNSHTNKNSPNVWNDGKHLNVHTDRHSNYVRN